MQKEIESAVSVIDTLGLEVVLVLSLLLAGGWAIKFLMGKSIELANKFLERIEKNMEELHEEVKTLDDKIIGQFNRRRGEDSEIWAMVDKNVDKKLNEQQAIIIKLVDRIRMLQEDMIRFDTMFRVKNELEIDYDRLGKSDRIDKN
jgi:predicted translin family RNA/ssDNA-binding protein